MSLFCFPYFPYLISSLLAVHLGSCPLCPLNTLIPSLIIYTPWYRGTFITEPASHWLPIRAIFSNVNLSSKVIALSTLIILAALHWAPSKLVARHAPRPFIFWRSPLCFKFRLAWDSVEMLGGVSGGKCKFTAVGCVPTLTSLGRCRVQRGLEMLSGESVVLFQVFAARPEVITTHLFQGIVQSWKLGAVDRF